LPLTEILNPEFYRYFHALTNSSFLTFWPGIIFLILAQPVYKM